MACAPTPGQVWTCFCLPYSDHRAQKREAVVQSDRWSDSEVPPLSSIRARINIVLGRAREFAFHTFLHVKYLTYIYSICVNQADVYMCVLVWFEVLCETGSHLPPWPQIHIVPVPTS